MGRSNRKSRRNTKSEPKRPATSHQPASSFRTKTLVQITLIVILLGLIGGMAWMSMRSPKPTVATGNTAPSVPVIPAASTASLHTDFAIKPQTLNELLDLPAEKLGEVDIARMNLLCASSLPSTKGLEVEHALSVLDEWAKRVTFETDRHLYRVTDPQYADHYGHSEAQFRAEMLVQVLAEDLGVKYNPQAIGNFSFADVATGFIHGMIPAKGQSMSDVPGGTCASMPVLYVAVGRRLGYPLNLATTDGHIFARWDGLNHPNPAWRERFNCETTNGFHRFDDDYYKTWPRKMADWEIKAKGHLLSLSPAEEMALFMATRGHHGEDVGQFGFAARCYENAYRYDTTRPAYRSWFLDAAMRSGYRPAPPALTQLVQQRRQVAATMASSPMLDGMPRRSQTRASLDPHMPVAPGVGGWQPPQPMTPGVPQPATPDMQPFNHTPQPEPFRSQP